MRYLVNLRLEEDAAIRVTDEQIKTLRETEERLNEQIIRLDQELRDARLDTQSQRKSPFDLTILRRLNEELRRTIMVQAFNIANLTEERDT